MKTILITTFLLFSINFYAQEEGTNPLANTLPPPIYVDDYVSDQERILLEQQKKINEHKRSSDTNVIELSDNVLNYQHEQNNPNPLESLEEKELKFNDFHENEITQEPVINNSQNSETGYWILGGFGILILIMLGFIFIKKGN